MWSRPCTRQSTFPAHTLFVTNSHLLLDAFDLDLAAKVSLAQGKDAFRHSCQAGEQCVIVLRNTGKRANHSSSGFLDTCEKSVNSYQMETVFCSFDNLEQIPGAYFEKPSFEAGALPVNIPCAFGECI